MVAGQTLTSQSRKSCQRLSPKNAALSRSVETRRLQIFTSPSETVTTGYKLPRPVYITRYNRGVVDRILWWLEHQPNGNASRRYDQQYMVRVAKGINHWNRIRFAYSTNSQDILERTHKYNDSTSSNQCLVFRPTYHLSVVSLHLLQPKHGSDQHPSCCDSLPGCGSSRSCFSGNWRVSQRASKALQSPL